MAIGCVRDRPEVCGAGRAGLRRGGRHRDGTVPDAQDFGRLGDFAARAVRRRSSHPASSPSGCSTTAWRSTITWRWVT